MGSRLRFQNVSFSYGDKPLIRDFTADIPDGRITSIVGPNGCGKSTLVKLANGFLKPVQGRILVDGTEVAGMPSRKRSQVMAVLPQSPGSPAMTVFELVACGRFPHVARGGGLSSEDRRIVDGAIDAVGLSDFRDADVRRLSGGERQIAYMAMAIAQDTPLVLLDEPTSFLDVQVCHRLLGIVERSSREEGKTFLIVIHDLDLALRYSDELIVIDREHGFFHGDRDEVLESKAIDRAFGIQVLRHCDDGIVTFSSIPDYRLMRNPPC